MCVGSMYFSCTADNKLSAPNYYIKINLLSLFSHLFTARYSNDKTRSESATFDAMKPKKISPILLRPNFINVMNDKPKSESDQQHLIWKNSV